MAANFDTIKKRIGKNLKIYSTTGGWTTTSGVTDITETDIGDIINELYRGDLFQLIVKQYPAYYRHIAHIDSWIATGTADATSTGTTLVATASIFNNTMVGLNVWNDTDSELAVIDAYTSGTTVTLDTTIGNTWDGDTIYVLGQEFTLGGDASDSYVIEDIGIKYNESDQYFRLGGNPRPKFDIFQTGAEKWSQAVPQTYLTSTQVGGRFVDTIGVLPPFSNKVTRALELTYTAVPPELTSTDVPRLPMPEVLIEGGTYKAFLQEQRWQEANTWLALYEKKKTEMIARFAPTATSTARTLRMPRRYYSTFRRWV